LAGAARNGGITGAGFAGNLEADAGERGFEVAGDVDGQGFQRRNVEGVKAGALLFGTGGRQRDKAWEKASERFACASWGD
jgi:hypothetical protein